MRGSDLGAGDTAENKGDQKCGQEDDGRARWGEAGTTAVADLLP